MLKGGIWSIGFIVIVVLYLPGEENESSNRDPAKGYSDAKNKPYRGGVDAVGGVFWNLL